MRRVAGILQAVASEDDLDEFLRSITLNVVIGNGDAHGKNFSLLHEASGALRLAPLYDLLCTLVYGQNRLAMYVDHVQRLERVTMERVVSEATSWGLSRRRAREVVGDLLGRLPSAIERAADETSELSEDVLQTVTQQLKQMRSG